MRSLSAKLSAAQKSPYVRPLVKIVLTRSGQTTYTYTMASGTLIDVDHREEPFSQKATVVLNNGDKALNDIDFRGYKGVISYGATTSDGAEYSATAPLYVVPQQFDSSGDALTCTLQLKGVPDLLDDDKASGRYIPGIADTVKDIIAGVLGATISVYSHCSAYTVDWDSEDALIDSFCPKQRIIISTNTSRLAIVQQLLSYTKCVMRVESDEHIAIFVPKIAGATWVANTVYAVHDYAQPSTPNNNFTYECTVAGTSHAATEPTWPTTAGNTVSDGTVTWTARAFDYQYGL